MALPSNQMQKNIQPITALPGGNAASPTPAPTNANTGLVGLSSPVSSTGTGDPAGGMVPYKPGPITQSINDLLQAAIAGTGAGSAIGGLLRGKIPAAIEQQFLQNQKIEDANITESMGKVGNRFGTDLTRTLADAAGRAQVNLSAQAMQNVINAFSAISGLGTSQSALEFQGEQNALDRANQDLLQSGGGMDPILQLLPILLGMR